MCDPNVEEKEETFLYETMAEKKGGTFLYNPNVSSRDRGEYVEFSGSDSRVVCPQKFQSQQESCAAVDHREVLENADHFLFGPAVTFPGVRWRLTSAVVSQFVPHTKQ